MSAIWESANWTRQFGIRLTGNRQFGMLPSAHTYIYMNINLYENKSGHYKHIYFNIKFMKINQDIISTYILISNL